MPVRILNAFRPEEKPVVVPKSEGHVELAPHQEKLIAEQMKWAVKHYDEAIWDSMGIPACVSNLENKPCLHHFGWINAMQVGLGKTAVDLQWDLRVRDFLKSKDDDRHEYPSLFIVENSTKWQLPVIEMDKWRPDLVSDDAAGKVMVIDGDSSQRDLQMSMYKRMKPEVVIITYSYLAPTSKGVYQFIRDIRWLGIYPDEATALKNWTSARTKRFNSISRFFCVPTSATPQSGWPDKWHALLHAVEPGFYAPFEKQDCEPGDNCPLPKYAQFRFKSAHSCEGCMNYIKSKKVCGLNAHKTETPLDILNSYGPGYWGDVADFRKEYCQMEGGRVVGFRNIDQLRKKILERHILGRVLSKDVYGERIIPINIELLQARPGQLEMYQLVAQGLRAMINENGERAIGRGSTSMLALLTHFRRITTMSPAAFMAGYSNKDIAGIMLDPTWAKYTESAKMEWALEFIENNVKDTGNSMIIGSEWTDPLDEMEVRLQKSGYQPARIRTKMDGNNFTVELPDPEGLYYGRIDGNVSPRQRLAIQEVFNSQPRLNIILMSKAGYKGMNLRGAGGEEDTVFISVLGSPWLPDELVQLFGRADRYDAKSSISIIIPALVGTIDEKIHSILYGKQISADQVIDGEVSDDGLASKLSLGSASDILNWI